MTYPMHSEVLFLRGDLRPQPDYFANLSFHGTLRDKAAPAV